MTNKIVQMAVLMLATMASLLLHAATDDTLLTFSTKGPDRYADGTPVLEGEVYAVVWTRNGSDFAGVDMNGRVVDAVNNAVMMYSPYLEESKKEG